MRVMRVSLMGLWADLNELIYIKLLEQHFIHKECYLDIYFCFIDMI